MCLFVISMGGSEYVFKLHPFSYCIGFFFLAASLDVQSCGMLV